MTEPGESAVIRAVRQMDASLAKAEEAKVHASAAAAAVAAMGVLYERAAGDVDPEAMRRAGLSAAAARDSMRAAIWAITNAQQSLRAYTRTIAPPYKVRDVDKGLDRPSGEDLITVPTRGAKGFLRAAVEKVDDVSDGVSSAVHSVRSLDEAFGPGASGSSRPMQPAQSGPVVTTAPQQASLNDPVAAATVLAVLGIRAGQSLKSLVLLKIKRRRSQ